MTGKPDPHPSISTLLETMQHAWNEGNAERFASVFTVDVDFINIVGQPIRGRTAVAAHHVDIFATVYRGSSLEALEPRITLIRDDVAVIEVAGTVVHTHREIHTHALAVAVADSDGWAIRAFHNMVPFAP